jgi:hypothetical protein
VGVNSKDSKQIESSKTGDDRADAVDAEGIIRTTDDVL